MKNATREQHRQWVEATRAARDALYDAEQGGRVEPGTTSRVVDTNGLDGSASVLGDIVEAALRAGSVLPKGQVDQELVSEMLRGSGDAGHDVNVHSADEERPRFTLPDQFTGAVPELGEITLQRVRGTILGVAMDDAETGEEVAVRVDPNIELFERVK